MSSTPTSQPIGTLVAVVLKARNLPNKRHIGKQSPYCALNFNGEKQRTKAIKKGGQHPEWDEEVRFSIYAADVNDDFEIVPHPNGSAPPPPPKEDTKGPRKVKGGTQMKLHCFADDPREPEVIGETVVDISEVLTTGETDEWFPLMYKEKYAGEVYLELTYFSSEHPPEKKKAPNPVSAIPQYGGSGSFVPFDDEEGAPQNGTYTALHPAPSRGHFQQPSDPSSSSSRPSSSVAQLGLLYAPAYETRPRGYSMENLTNEFGEMGVLGNLRDNLPVPAGEQHPHGWPQSQSLSSIAPAPQGSSFDTAYYHHTGQSQDPVPSSFRGRSVSPMPAHEREPPQVSNPLTRRSTRYSLPAASSGFMPLSSRASEPSGFLPQHTGFSARVPSGFTPPTAMPLPSSTPAPHAYSAIQHSSSLSTLPQPPGGMAYPSQGSLPHPPGAIPQSYSFQGLPPAHSSSLSSLPQSHSYQYYPPYTSVHSSTLPQPPAPPGTLPPPASQYLPNPTPSPPRDHSPLHNTAQPPNGGSRPLPPQPPNPGHFLHSYSAPPAPSTATEYLPRSGSYEQYHTGYDSPSRRPPSAFASVPPPPPLPDYAGEEPNHHPSFEIPHPPRHAHSVDDAGHLSSFTTHPSPLPDPRQSGRRQSSLPQPPVGPGQYHRVSNAYQSIPPPPPVDYQQQSGYPLPQPPSSTQHSNVKQHQFGGHYEAQPQYETSYDQGYPPWPNHMNNAPPHGQAAWG
ncbi:hypothetical protein BDV98DRAFT_569216 [Pterulicium gracile]|uniref:C2 domain-containing protein n=1 Tax=Pterulicium gracile TaxID=1884261 RepID=A0A5C3QQE6_9AGAR|nr:hypothetical protein BDV98DRAFT_569216 [Pterula gracilis]